MDELDGRVALVTGASSGIGRAIALMLARNGADVAITYQGNAQGANDTADAIRALGRRVAVLQLDLRDVAAVEAIGPTARESLGRLDIWVNNAGADILTGANASMTDIERLNLLMEVDLRGTMLASWSAARLFDAQEAGGVIINISWDHVLTGMSGRNPEMFAAVKGGVLAFSKALARSVAPRVRVNVVAPGWIETAFGAGVDRVVYQRVAESTPMKRWGTPDDVAGAVVYLASPAASFVTGATIVVGGGRVMG